MVFIIGICTPAVSRVFCSFKQLTVVPIDSSDARLLESCLFDKGLDINGECGNIGLVTINLKAGKLQRGGFTC